ncbi:MAG TPA: acetoacetate decarboxylase [Ottowia sp.]|uniref:acetoacetate decarboxylase n=1 Tax=Ottowia sp. TaxID=1898956 RepID=UPI002BD0A696|nr:acetoacetate decarboxylase [Ottowia sp.]HMN20946.1 acetoacetate decarboxylase [Ottowia sp.]
MKKADILKQLTTPIGGPAFTRGPFRFYNREYFNILYRTDYDALRAVVPEPLEIDEPLVRWEVMRMPDTEGLGDYTECGQAIQVRLGQEKGEYLHAMYLDNLPALASGREVSAYPKKWGAPRLYVDSDTLVGTLDYGTLRVATATMGYKHRRLDPEQARAELCLPTFMLKLLWTYDSPEPRGEPRIAELLRTQITDITIKGAWKGPARLQLFEHALAPMADFPVREIVSASHILTDLTLARAKRCHDYLDDAS